MPPRLLLPVLLLSVIAFRADAAERPNVLFLISDDLNNFLGLLRRSAGQDAAPRPSGRPRRAVRAGLLCLSRSAGRAAIRCSPACIPTARAFLANQQIFRQTIPSHLSLPQAFRLEGYFAGRIGKLYHYNVPKSIGTNGHDDPGSWELELNPAGVRPAGGGARRSSPLRRGSSAAR